MTSKWDIAADTFGRPVRVILTGGNASDPKLGILFLAGLPAHHDLADKAYDTNAILDYVETSGAQPIIPRRVCMPRQRAFDPAKYKLRNRIERTVGKLKQLRRIATRYDRIPQTISQDYAPALSASGAECRFNLRHHNDR